MRKNSVLSFLFTAVLILMLCASCGGGGGGATLYNPENSPPRNEGINHNWGAGSSGTTTGFTVGSGSSETLFSAFPSFFSPIDHIDISLSINGGAPITLTGLNASSTRDALPALSIGDVVTGTATITLQDGSTRPAVLSAMTVGSGTELRFAVQYKYVLQISSNSGLPHVNGTYYSATGINIIDAGAGSWTAPGTGTPVSYWEADNGARYAGNVLSGFLGDITLTAKFAFGCTTPNNATIYRYCMDSTDTPVTASFSLSGGTGPYTVSCSSNVLSGTASGSTVNISIDSSFTGTLSNSFSAAGEPVTVTVTDDSTNETTTCTINVVDCVGDTYGIELNPALSSVTGLTLDLPSDGKINGSVASTSIRANAFTNCTSITSLTLPSTVNTISTPSGVGGVPGSGTVTTPGAFGNSSITTFTAPGLRTIGQGAFGQSQISSIDLSQVTSVGNYAFYGCPNLASIDLSGLTTSLGQCAFADCTSLSSVTWWTSNAVTSIPRYAFYNTGLTSLNVPSSVQTIGDYAFENCANLTSVDLANVTSSIGQNAFKGCTSLQTIKLPANYTFSTYGINNVFADCSGVTKIESQGTTITRSMLGNSIANLSPFTNLEELDFRSCEEVTIGNSDFKHSNRQITVKLSVTLRNLTICIDSGVSNLPYQPIIEFPGTSVYLQGNVTLTVDSNTETTWDGTKLIEISCIGDSPHTTLRYNGSNWVPVP